ncbi:MAG: hypothetical protein WBQ53_01880 [Methylocystis sp.]
MIRGEIWDRPNGRYLAYIDDSDNLISTKTGATIGTHKDGKLYNLDNDLIGALVPISSSQTSVEGQALDRLERSAGWS